MVKKTICVESVLEPVPANGPLLSSQLIRYMAGVIDKKKFLLITSCI